MKNEKTLKWSLAACRVNAQMTQFRLVLSIAKPGINKWHLEIRIQCSNNFNFILYLEGTFIIYHLLKSIRRMVSESVIVLVSRADTVQEKS